MIWVPELVVVPRYRAKIPADQSVQQPQLLASGKKVILRGQCVTAGLPNGMPGALASWQRKQHVIFGRV